MKDTKKKQNFSTVESKYSKLLQVNQQERLEKTLEKAQKNIVALPEAKPTTREKYFLGGFFEGEASLYASVKSNKTSKFGFYVDPEFAVYQHSSGLFLLERSKLLFNCGSIYKKPGSENVWNFTISNRKTILEKVIPFYEKYVFPFSAKQESFLSFKELVISLEKKEHLSKEGMRKILTLAYTLNPFSKGKARKRTLQEILQILESSETIRLTTVCGFAIGEAFSSLREERRSLRGK
jgi:hypothetical protein